MSDLTTNTIPKATSNTNIQDSSITDDGTNVTISENLAVTGNFSCNTGSVYTGSGYAIFGVSPSQPCPVYVTGSGSGYALTVSGGGVSLDGGTILSSGTGNLTANTLTINVGGNGLVYTTSGQLNSDTGITTNGSGTLTAASIIGGLLFPQQAPTVSAPTYAKGALYFDTTLNKLRVGGATDWETITSV